MTNLAIAGDSTTTEALGWGQSIGPHGTAPHDLPGILAPGVTVANFGQNGASTQTFIADGHWADVLAEQAVYVLIQFGHNDRHVIDPAKGTYPVDSPPNVTPGPGQDFKANLTQMVADVRAYGGIPILISPPSTHDVWAGDLANHIAWQSTQDTAGNRYSLAKYARATWEVALAEGVNYIALNEVSHAKFLAIYHASGEADLSFLEPTTGDNTHFSLQGSRILTEIIRSELARMIRTAEDDSNAVLNSFWLVVLKVHLGVASAFIPFTILFGVWVVSELYTNKSFRESGERHSKLDDAQAQKVDREARDLLRAAFDARTSALERQSDRFEVDLDYIRKGNDEIKKELQRLTQVMQ